MRVDLSMQEILMLQRLFRVVDPSGFFLAGTYRKLAVALAQAQKEEAAKPVEEPTKPVEEPTKPVAE